MDDAFLASARGLLCDLGVAVCGGVIEARRASSAGELGAVAAVTAADTIYAIDRVGEAAIGAWFEANWPATEPVEVVMEGLADGTVLTFPRGMPVAATKWKAILDPIDGTRCLLYDKRPAWSLAALAPQRGAATSLRDIVVAAMTEIPTTKQWRADQVSGVRGRGVVAVARDLLRGGGPVALELRPSAAGDLQHGFCSLVKFFPEGKALTARLEEMLLARLGETGRGAASPVFDDQYVCSGGQLYELMAGRDRATVDLRPLVFRKLGVASPLACHPYDVCTAMLLVEAGGVVESPDGALLDAPLDTTTPVAWVGYANERLAARMRPVLRELCAELLSA